MAARQDLTLFGDDDATPLVGTVDANGNITVASFSTDPAHPRPWLDEATEGVGQEINLIEGTATIGEFRVTILDKRTVATDQRTGFLTNLLSTQQGYSALTMRRAVYRIEGPDGLMHVAQNGVMTTISLNADSASYDISIRDMSERARKTRIFNKLTGPTPRYTVGTSRTPILGPTGATYPVDTHYIGDPIPGDLPKYGSCLYPVGPLNGYGRLGSLPNDPTLAAALGGSFLIKPVRPSPLRAVFVRDTSYPTFRGVFKYTPTAPSSGVPLTDAAYQAGWPSTGIDPFTGNPYSNLIYQDSIIFWRKVGSTNWHRVESMPYRSSDRIAASPNSISTAGSPYPQQLWGVPGAGDPRTSTNKQLTIQVTFSTPNHQDLPVDQSQCDVLVMDGGAPSQDKPIYVGSTWGTLLKDIYDGLYSVGFNGGPTPIFATGSGYNAAVFAQLAVSTPYLEFRKVASEDDALSWLPPNMYKPWMAVPSIDKDGLLSPYFSVLPDASVALTQIDDTNTEYESATWELTSDGAVNEVLFTYMREYVLNGAITQTQEVDLQFIDTTAEAIGGEKEVTYAPETVVSVIGITTANVDGGGDTTNDLGTKLASQRANDVRSRFRYGNQNLELTCQRSAAAIESLQAGAWCIVALSWLPDFATRIRGTNRLMQVMSRKNLDEAFCELKLSDAGPSGQPAVQPTVDTITVNPLNAIDVPILALQDGTKAVVQYNLGTGGSISTVFGYTVGDSVPGTFTRAASAYRTNSDGTLTYVGANVARDAHYIGAARTLVLEPTRTNRFLQSKLLANAAWIKGVTAAPTVTAGAYTSPDGVAASAASVALATAATGVSTRVYQNAAGQPAAVQTFSAYLRGDVGGESLWMNANVTSTSVLYDAATGALATSWARFAAQTGTEANYSAGFGVEMRTGFTGGSSETAKPSQTVGGWGLQLETGTYATSYIPTTSATATRDADVLTFTVPGGAGQVGTLYEHYVDLATGLVVEQVSPYTTSTTYVPQTGRGWISWKFALGTQSLSQMQAATSSGTGGASTTPAQNDGGWLFMGSVIAPGFVESQSMPSGATVWVRVRAENGQRVGSAAIVGVPIRASAWTTPVAVQIPNVPVVTAFAVSVVQFSGLTHIHVETSSATAGVRVYYGQKVYDGTEPNMTSYVEFPVVGGVLDVDLPMVARFGFTQYVDVYPSSGWDAVNSITSGSYGIRSRGFTSFAIEGGAIMPTAYGVMDETATLGTLSVYVNDPQNRVTLVEANSQVGTSAWSGWATALGTASPYRASVDLVQKQPSKVGYRIWAADANNVIAIVAEDTFTFSLSGLPLPPALREFVDTFGNFEISWQGDFDTNYIKVAASIVDFPTPDTVRAGIAQPGATGLTTPLLIDVGGATEATVQSGQTIFVAAFAYNADGLEGALALYKVTYLGIGSTPLPDVVIGTPVPTGTNVYFPFSWDAQTTDIIAWFKVYTSGTAPSAAFNVTRVTGAVALQPISIAEGVMGITVPLANATDVAFLSLTGTDPLNQRGPVANARQAGNGAATFPAAPTAASNTGNTSSLTTNSVTTPSSALTTWKIRTYKNGVAFGTDTPVAVAGAHAQSISYVQTTGDVVTYTYTMIDNTGAESTSSTTPFTVTTPAPSAFGAPTITSFIYDTSSQTIDVSITPAGGTPNNVTWHISTGATATGTFTEDTSAASFRSNGSLGTTLQTFYAQKTAAQQRYVKVWGTAGGVTGTTSSAAGPVSIPAASGGGGGGHTAQ